MTMCSIRFFLFTLCILEIKHRSSVPYPQSHLPGLILGFLNKILIVYKVYEVGILAPKKTTVTLETFSSPLADSPLLEDALKRHRKGPHPHPVVTEIFF